MVGKKEGTGGANASTALSTVMLARAIFRLLRGFCMYVDTRSFDRICLWTWIASVHCISKEGLGAIVSRQSILATLKIF